MSITRGGCGRSQRRLQLVLDRMSTWRSDGEPGPLQTLIDSGAGRLGPPAEGGVTVAEVQVDLGATASRLGQPHPNSCTRTRTPSRSPAPGFAHVEQVDIVRPAADMLRRSASGRGVNYTVSSYDDNKLELVLAWFGLAPRRREPARAAHCWRLSSAAAVAIDQARPLIRVALTIFECPSVNPQPLTALFRTHSAQLWITGVGFTRSDTRNGFGGEVKIDFEPALKVGVDYMLTVFNRTHMLVRLTCGAARVGGN